MNDNSTLVLYSNMITDCIYVCGVAVKFLQICFRALQIFLERLITGR